MAITIHKREPVLTAAVTTAVLAVIGVLVAFGVNVSDTQTKAIVGLIVAVLPIVAGFVARSKVSPVAK